MTTISSLGDLTDAELLARVKHCAQDERQATAELIATLAEVDARRLYLGEGCSSLFTYCTQVLRLSEHAAYGRIEAARAARRFPVILELLCDGSMTLTAVGLLAHYLTDENYREVLDSARHKSKRDVEEIVATLRPKPDAPSTVRQLPGSRIPQPIPPPSPGFLMTSTESQPDPCPVSFPSPPPIVKALAPQRFKVQFTISRETHDKLRRAQDLMRHSIPNGDPALIFDRALALLVENLERSKLAAVTRPRSANVPGSRSRHVPTSVRREVWKRDAGQCAFVGTQGRCTERGFLEFHHVVPWADGGQTTIENLQLRCRAHNAYEAELFSGPWTVRERLLVELGPDRVL